MTTTIEKAADRLRVPPNKTSVKLLSGDSQRDIQLALCLAKTHITCQAHGISKEEILAEVNRALDALQAAQSMEVPSYGLKS